MEEVGSQKGEGRRGVERGRDREREKERESEREARSCWFILYLSCFPPSSLLFRSHTDLHSPATNEGSTPTHCNATLWESTHTHTHIHTHCTTATQNLFLCTSAPSFHLHTMFACTQPWQQSILYPAHSTTHTHIHTPMHTHCIVHTQNCKLSAFGCTYASMFNMYVHVLLLPQKEVV